MSFSPQPKPIELSEREKRVLEQIVRGQRNPQNLVRRAKIILTVAEGMNNQQAAHQLKLDRETVRVWRERWLEASPILLAAETEEVGAQEWLGLIEMVLSDASRPGAPATFTPEQIVQIVAVACENPAASGHPISHWTPRELADEVIQREIVMSISPRSVGRFLDEADLKPHLCRYWLNASPDDPETFAHPLC